MTGKTPIAHATRPTRLARRAAAALLLALSLGAAQPAAAQQAPAQPAAAAPPAPALLEAMRAGGLVLLWRHPATHNDQADTNPFDLTDCTRQRQLNDTGREQARTLGAALRARGVAVGSVIASPFCRAREAAELLGLGPVTLSVDIAEGGLVVPPDENGRRARALRALLAAAPAGTGNVLLVSHRPNIMDAVGVEAFNIAEGEIFVFRAQAEAPGFRLIGRVPIAAWSAAGG